MAAQKRNFILGVGSPGNVGWDQPITEEEKVDIRKFNEECLKRFVTYVPAIHPGYFYFKGGTKIYYSDEKQIQGMLQHLTDLHELGFRLFSIHLDDMGRFGGQDEFIYEDEETPTTEIVTEEGVEYIYETAPDDETDQ